METPRWRRWWASFWFEPVEPVNLGICRVIFFAGLFCFYFFRDVSAWAQVSEVFWMPITMFKRLHLPVLSFEILVLVQIVWKLSLGLICIGLLTRVNTMISFVLGAYLLGLPHNFGKTYHWDAVLLITLGTMAVARSGDACSVDRWIRRTVPAASGEYP